MLIDKVIKKTILFFFIFLFCSAIQAEDISVTGIRSVLWFDVYEARLTTSKEQALNKLKKWSKSKEEVWEKENYIEALTRLPWDIQLNLKRDLTSQEVAEAIGKALKKNLGDSEEHLIAEFIAFFEHAEQLKKGDQIWFKLTGEEVVSEVPGKINPKTISSSTLSKALAGIYLGNEAVIDDLAESFTKALFR